MTEEKAAEDRLTEFTTVVKKERINIDFAHGIVPQDYNEMMQIAALLFKSKLVPKSLVTLEQVAIAVMMCLELGRTPAVGIQDIAVINGKAGIFGDAALAIVRASGLLERFKEWEEGTPYTDDWTFYCLIKRKGMPDERKGSWSWVDAKKAGFDKIQAPSPWFKYTRRMMQFKARNFPLRDEFGDVLKGMRLSEDNMDAIDMYPDDTGAYKEEAKTEKGPVEGIDEINADFRAFAKTLDVEDVLIGAFIKETSEANKMTVRAVKSEALKDYDSFKKALEKWVGEKEKADEQDGPDLFDRLKAMRPGTSEQNQAVFKKQVLENLDEIRSWPDNKRDYITLKWTRHIKDSSLTEILAETAPVDAEEEDQKEDRPPNPPMFRDEDAGKPGGPANNEPHDEPEHIPPWARRKHFLDAMKDEHDKNKLQDDKATIYYNVLGAHGCESANDVPAEADKEAEILAIMKSEVPG